MSTNKNVAECIYCGSNKSLTHDHIPPKNLFPKPRPSNLITVDSCKECNKGASQDDEYFRLMLSMRHDTGDHAAVKGILPSVYRSLEKPKKRGFVQSLLNSMCDVEIHSPGGLYLNTANGYQPDLDRLDRVAVRITKGLFFHEFGSRIPDEYEVKSYSESGLENIDRDAKAKVSKIFGQVTQSQSYTLGNEVFTYWFRKVQDHDVVSAWVLRFYENVFFFSAITPIDKVI